jgi:thiol:disulfide interchange protein
MPYRFDRPRALMSVAFSAALLVLGGACGRTETTIDESIPTPPEGPGNEWNDAQIAWQPYAAGLAKAKAENKPVCLVVYGDWCPHCTTYKRVFRDARVVKRARDFVMIRVNGDQEEATAEERQAPDGKYVPRTFFLSPNGAHAENIHAGRSKYRYFFDEHNPASLLGGMEKARRLVQ